VYAAKFAYPWQSKAEKLARDLHAANQAREEDRTNIALQTKEIEELQRKLAHVTTSRDEARQALDKFSAMKIGEIKFLNEEKSKLSAANESLTARLARAEQSFSKLKSEFDLRKESDELEASLLGRFSSIPHQNRLKCAKPCVEEVRLPQLLIAGEKFVSDTQSVKESAAAFERTLQELSKLQVLIKNETDDDRRRKLLEERRATVEQVFDQRGKCEQWQEIMSSSCATCKQKFDEKFQNFAWTANSPTSEPVDNLKLIDDKAKLCLNSQKCFRETTFAEQKRRCRNLDTALKALATALKPHSRRDLSTLPNLLRDLYAAIQGFIAPLPADHVSELKSVEGSLCLLVGSVLVDASNISASLKHLFDVSLEGVRVLQNEEVFAAKFFELREASQTTKENLRKRNKIKDRLMTYEEELVDGSIVEEGEREKHLEKIARFKNEYDALVEQAAAMNDSLQFLRQHQHLFPEYSLQELCECQSASLAGLILHEGVVYRSLNDYVFPRLVEGRCFPASLNGTPCYLRCCNIENKETEQIVRRELRVKERVRSTHVMSPDLIFIDMPHNRVVFHYRNMLGTLGEVAAAQGSFTIDTLLEVSQQLVAGLLSMHDFKVVHGDISPANVLLDHHHHAFLADFAESTCDETRSMTRATFGYLAPEALKDLKNFTATLQSDAFALGVTLKEILDKLSEASQESRHQALGDIYSRTLLQNDPNSRSLKLCQEKLICLRKLWRAEDDANQKELGQLLRQIQEKEQALEVKLSEREEANAADVEQMHLVVKEHQKDVEAKRIELQSLRHQLDDLKSSLQRSQKTAELEKLRLQEEVKAANAAASEAASRASLLEAPSYWLTTKAGPMLRRRTQYMKEMLRNVVPNMKHVERVENYSLWVAFRAECNKLSEMMSGQPFSAIPPPPAPHNHELSGLITPGDSMNVGEVYLFHGTDSASLPSIIEMGFDPSWSNRGLLGHGSYFTPCFQKALAYAGKTSGSKVIVIARVAVGIAEVLPPGQQRSDLRKPSDGRHSVFGTPNSQTPGMLEVVVYTINRAYPEFVVYLS
jgi:serine/threonine protein kinase